MRTATEEQRMYKWIPLREAGERLGGVSEQHVLGLGRDGELSIKDFRRTNAKKGRYFVDPTSVDALIERRTLARTCQK